MDNVSDLPRIIEGTLHRILQPEDLAAIFRYEHEWYLYYLLLLTTGIRPDDAALLANNHISLKRNIIGYFPRGSEKYREVPVPQDVLSLVPHDHSAEQPLFPELFVDVEDPWIREEVLNERLGQPAEFMESLLAAADRPAASLISFRITFEQITREGPGGSGPAGIPLKTILPETMEIPRT